MLSIIIPAYNDERQLFSLIGSILDQSFHNYELIIVDGGSKDKTRESARKIKKRLALSKFPIPMILKNYGRNNPQMQKNIGAALASGNVLLFITPDITLDSPNFLYAMMRILENQRFVGATCTICPKGNKARHSMSCFTSNNFLKALSKIGLPSSRPELQFVKLNPFFKARGFIGDDFTSSIYLASNVSRFGSMIYVSRMHAFSSGKRCAMAGYLNSVIMWPLCYLLHMAVASHQRS